MEIVNAAALPLSAKMVREMERLITEKYPADTYPYASWLGEITVSLNGQVVGKIINLPVPTPEYLEKAETDAAEPL